MGQVLIIQNKINGKSVNTVYYHWGAYTKDSIAKLKTFANHLLENYHYRSTEFLSTLTNNGKELLDKFDNGSLTNQNKIDLFNLMSYISISGTSASRQESLDYLAQFTTNLNRKETNRNNGMLAVSEKDQNDHLFWSDGTIIVDWGFDDRGYPDFEQTVFDFSNLFSKLDEDKYKEIYPNANVKALTSLLSKNLYKTKNILLSEIKQLQMDLKCKSHIWRNDNNEIFMFIK